MLFFVSASSNKCTFFQASRGIAAFSAFPAARHTFGDVNTCTLENSPSFAISGAALRKIPAPHKTAYSPAADRTRIILAFIVDGNDNNYFECNTRSRPARQPAEPLLILKLFCGCEKYVPADRQASRADFIQRVLGGMPERHVLQPIKINHIHGWNLTLQERIVIVFRAARGIHKYLRVPELRGCRP